MAIYGDLSVKGGDFFKYDANAIYQKMKLLLESQEGDWFFNREFNCDLKKYLFRKYEPWVIDELKFDLSICFNKFLPEVKLLKETDFLYDPDKRLYVLHIVFEIPGIDNVYTYDYHFEIRQ